MPRLRYSHRAARDLREILQYVTRESGSVETGTAFVAKVRRRCADLSALPGQMGRPRPDLLPELRSIAFRDYVIFFQYQREDFYVVAIIEGHRDIEQHFQRGMS